MVENINIKELYDSALEKEMYKKTNSITELDQKLKILAIFYHYDEKKKLDKDFHKEMMELITRYEEKSKPLYKRINDIVKGEILDSKEILFIQSHLSAMESKDKEAHINKKEVKNYWTEALKNCDFLANEFRSKDWELVNHLKSIDYHKERELQKIVITFTFERNAIMDMEVLTKTFIMSDDETPLESKGTEIKWKNESKNLMKMKAMMLKRNPKTGTEKREDAITDDETFFNFFKSVNLRNVDTNERESANARMDLDFDIARVLMDELIPYSLEYFLNVRNSDDSNKESRRDKEKHVEKADQHKKRLDKTPSKYK